MTRRVLLTGGSGFIGRQAFLPLLNRGFEVHAIARRNLGVLGVVSHVVDLLDHEATSTVVQKIRADHLLHLAWDVTPGRFWWDEKNLAWVEASLNLYRAFAAAGGQRVTAAGTCAEYDWVGGVLDEDAPLRPATLYGVAKNNLHRLLSAAASHDDISLAWGRFFFLYGPHEARQRLVPSVIVPLLNGEPALLGDGTGIRDFMHVQDAAAGVVAVLDSNYVGSVNIATGQKTTIEEVVKTITARIGRPDLVRLGARPTAPDDPPVLAASGSALASLGFRPTFTLQTGLSDTISWWEGVGQQKG